MICSRCAEEFTLTLARYMGVAFARFACPHCEARLRLRQTWYYWVWLLGFGIIAIVVPAQALVWAGLPGALLSMAVLGLVGVALDWRLEARLATPVHIGPASDRE